PAKGTNMRTTKGSRRNGLRLIAAALVIGVTAGALALLYGGAESKRSAYAVRQALASPGANEPGEVSRGKVEQVWKTRLTYPTGRFDQRWVGRAARQAERIEPGIPKGYYRTRGGRLVRSFGAHSGAQAVEALAAARALGP